MRRINFIYAYVYTYVHLRVQICIHILLLFFFFRFLFNLIAEFDIKCIVPYTNFIRNVNNFSSKFTYVYGDTSVKKLKFYCASQTLDTVYYRRKQLGIFHK